VFIYVIALIAVFVVVLTLVLVLLFKNQREKAELKITQLVSRIENQEIRFETLVKSLAAQHARIDVIVEQIDRQELNDKNSIELTNKQIQCLQTNWLQAQQNIEQVNLKLEQVQDQQPEDKLYSRAYKLAALGAGLEEIMSECELPRAEAEMLLSVYTKNIR
jgi:predicted  nucleic acid-binding Zn-ribbon protein